MTKGRKGGVPSNALDMIMGELSQISTNIMVQRKDILSGKSQSPQNPSVVPTEAPSQTVPSSETVQKEGKSRKDLKNRLREKKK